MKRKSISLFPKEQINNISEKYVEKFKNLSIDLNVKDHYGDYNWELAYEVVHFVNLYISKFLKQKHQRAIMCLPHLRYYHNLTKIQSKAKSAAFKNIKEKEDFVDWYNDIIDNILKRGPHRVVEKYFRKISCPNPNVKLHGHKKLKDLDKQKMFFDLYKKHKEKYLHKAIKVIVGEHIDKSGLIIAANKLGRVKVKLSDGNIINTHVKNILLLDNKII